MSLKGIKLAESVPIEFHQVHKTFPTGTQALNDISLRIADGEFVSILGPSGCGKSTLLRLIAGLEKPTQGRVHITETEAISFVFQDPHLLPWRSVRKNIELPMEILRRTSKTSVDEIIGMVGLKGFEEAYPSELSGGMRMRCSLARALMSEPRILLLDEPFAALDEWTRLKLDSDLRRLWSEKKMTVIFVTHSISEALYLSDRCLVLSKRPGRILEDGRVNLPATRELQIRMSESFNSQALQLAQKIEASL